ncbi:MAG: NADPH-dependent 7-cyano-7-deazaguanine reductase [candidate division TA06 bacterium ADurb.Bin131]|jgi:7-cyano-7-deazaguanine reductase|uniref:NADPH-dependent 7-cyano-7-deazaguanine reductase n=1 Tax=candidate division TA06 bacterium ADurb.Bin131 TaxID=1852827 RepID=A0A1V6CDZ3_UNCT6|nr:MAG: NADPH-dependent 7-cyano-7-deazaguanine reductase [candidate division TA06 bacterium ADurb.Bin131]
MAEKKIRYQDLSSAGIDANLPAIEWFKNSYRNYTITIVIPEYTSLCPKTGNPDFGTITIQYQPKERVIELKSLKEYIFSYRNLGIFYENAVNRILKDIVSSIKPVWVSVKGEFTPRGGIHSIVEARWPQNGVNS